MKTRPYQPNNGTAGMIFDDIWCSNCQRDLAWRTEDTAAWARGNRAPPPVTPAKPCDILSRSFVFKPGDPEYPVEWIEDDVPYPQPSNPRCTAFVAIDDPSPSTYCPDPRQGELEL